jgi:uncharacterized protein (DUF2132 family)
MNQSQPKNPLHGITLEMVLTRLVDCYGWEELGRRIRINCFARDPSIKSSLKFLRRTPWARDKVEALYLKSLEDDNVKK